MDDDDEDNDDAATSEGVYVCVREIKFLLRTCKLFWKTALEITALAVIDALGHGGLSVPWKNPKWMHDGGGLQSFPSGVLQVQPIVHKG